MGVRSKRTPLIDPSIPWYDQQTENTQTAYQIDDSLVREANELTENLFSAEIERYLAAKGPERNNFEWMLKTRWNGTRQDKMSALFVTLEDSLPHNLGSLDTLVQRVASSSAVTKDVFELMAPLTQIFIERVLPDRKLVAMNVRPITKDLLNVCKLSEQSKKTMMLWYFEGKVKSLHGDLIAGLKFRLMKAQVPNMKTDVLKSMQQFLVNKPENENIILPIIIDKLGDPDVAVSSNVLRIVQNIVEMHPPMKMIVFKHLESLLFRKNVPQKAQYYSLVAVSTMELDRGQDQQLAQLMIDCYLAMFRTICVEGGEINSRILLTLISGMRTAIAICNDAQAKINEEQLKSIFTIIHTSQINTAIQALSLIFCLIKSRPDIADRYYCAMYQKMQALGTLASNKEHVFLKLLFQSLKCDSSVARQKAFVKRLLTICLNSMPAFIVSSLVLVSEICRLNPSLSIFHEHAGLTEFCNVTDAEIDQTQAGSWVHTELHSATIEVKGFDVKKRNPLFARADECCCSEVVLLAKHSHPTVHLFANSLLKGESIQYPNSPFEDFKLMKFLDQLAFKKPKKEKVKACQKKKNINPEDLFVIDKQFLKLDEKQVPVHEVFLHRYLSENFKEKKSKRWRDKEEHIDDMFEKYLEKRYGLKSQFRAANTKSDTFDFASNYEMMEEKSDEAGHGGKEEDDASDSDIEKYFEIKKSSKKRLTDKKMRKRTQDVSEMMDEPSNCNAIDSFTSVPDEKELKQSQWEQKRWTAAKTPAKFKKTTTNKNGKHQHHGKRKGNRHGRK